VGRLLVNCAVRLLAIVLVAGIAMLLVRYGPGFETDDRDSIPDSALPLEPPSTTSVWTKCSDSSAAYGGAISGNRKRSGFRCAN